MSIFIKTDWSFLNSNHIVSIDKTIKHSSHQYLEKKESYSFDIQTNYGESETISALTKEDILRKRSDALHALGIQDNEEVEILEDVY